MRTRLATLALCLFTLPVSAQTITLAWDLDPNETTATMYGKYVFLAYVDQNPDLESSGGTPIELSYWCEDAAEMCQAQIDLGTPCRGRQRDCAHTIYLRTFRVSDGMVSTPTPLLYFSMEN